MEVKIKQLTIDDYDEIIRIWSIAGLPFRPKGRDSKALMGEEMKIETSCFFGLIAGNAMIGVAIGSYDGRRGWINRLAIDPDYRGKGYGMILIEHVHEYLISRGALVMAALIHDDNYPSISIFQKAGYVCEKEILYFAKRPSPDA